MTMKLLAYPLAIPSTIHIGDVGVYLPNGSFHKHFNICEPPSYFLPLHSAMGPGDICTYLDFEPLTFLTSSTIERCEDYAGTV